MVLRYEVRNFVQKESFLRIITLEHICGLHFLDHVLILVLGSDVLVVEGPSDARLEDQILIETQGL